MRVDSLGKNIHEQKERMMRTELQITDWGETPIVDFVWIQPDPLQTLTTEIGEYTIEGPELNVERYESPAPPIDESSVVGKKCEIQRVTKPLYDKIQKEYDLPEL